MAHSGQINLAGVQNEFSRISAQEDLDCEVDSAEEK